MNTILLVAAIISLILAIVSYATNAPKLNSIAIVVLSLGLIAANMGSLK